ncbi:MAG: hypothetical protein J2P19_05805 [Pseudonocardia sp.]|nr:hypothetical protein [Pseudonocardia sp.]
MDEQIVEAVRPIRPIVTRRRLAGGAAAGIVGMLAWVGGLAMMPTDAQLSDGDAAIAAMIATSGSRLLVAVQLGAVGAVLLLVLLVVLAWAVPTDAPGGLALRVGLAAGVLTQAVVGTAAWSAAVGAYLAGAGGGAPLVAAAWAGLFVGFAVSAVPTVAMTAGVALGAHRARLAPPWVTALGLVSAVAHVLAATAFARVGPFALDGIVGLVAPLITAVWITAQSAVLLRGVS